VLSEVQQTVDDVVIISRGRLVRQASLADLEGAGTVRVRTPSAAELTRALAAADLRVTPGGEDGVLLVGAADPAKVGHLAFTAGVELHELGRAGSDLEQIFLSLTADQPEPPAAAAAPGTSVPVPTGAVPPGPASGARQEGAR
jgi:ABC-2 type transport system ATP-binding protein